jgi:hypothetical protein
MRATLGIILLGSLIACSSNPAPDTGADQTVRVSGAGGGELRIRPVADANIVIIAAPKEQVWPFLLSAFDSVGLTADPTLTSAKTYVISSGTLNIRRQLGGAPLSKYIDCGNTQIGASADNYQIAMQVTTRLVPQQGGTTGVSTVLEAAGKPVAFSQEYRTCTSTGRLETLLGEIIRKKFK